MGSGLGEAGEWDGDDLLPAGGSCGALAGDSMECFQASPVVGLALNSPHHRNATGSGQAMFNSFEIAGREDVLVRVLLSNYAYEASPDFRQRPPEIET